MEIFLSSAGFILCLILGVVCWGISLFFISMNFWTSTNYSWLTIDAMFGVFVFIVGCSLMWLGFHYSPFEINFSLNMRH